MNFSEYLDTIVNEDDYVIDMVMDELDNDVNDLEDETLDEKKAKPRTNLDRKKVRARKDVINQATGGKWGEMDLRQRAQFLAKNQVVNIGSDRAKVIKRVPPLDVNKVLKKLKAGKKRFKRVGKSLRAKGKRRGLNVQ